MPRALLARPRLGAEARRVAQRTSGPVAAGPRPPARRRRRSPSGRGDRRAGPGSTEREAEARITLSLALFQAGRARVALEEIERAEAVATGHTALLASAQHGTLLERLGRLEEALARYDAALAGAAARRGPALRARTTAPSPWPSPDGSTPPWPTSTRPSVWPGRPTRPMPEAELIHNLGFVLTVAGDLPAALARFDEADARFMALGAPIGLNLVGAGPGAAAGEPAPRGPRRRDVGRGRRVGGRPRRRPRSPRRGCCWPRPSWPTATRRRRSPRPSRPAARCTARAGRGWPPRPSTSSCGRGSASGAGTAARWTWPSAAPTRCATAGLVAEELDARLTAALTARLLGDGERPRPASTSSGPGATAGRCSSDHERGTPRRSTASTAAIAAAPRAVPSRPVWTPWPASRR